MLQSPRFISIYGIATVAVLALICASCGTSSNSHTLSPAQAQAVAQELDTAMSAALSAGLTGAAAADAKPPRLSTVLRSVHTSGTPSGCTITNTGENCNIPITYSGPCPNGGTIGVTGDFIFSLDTSGNGSDNSTLTVTPTNCAVSNTTFNGKPNITVATAFSFANNLPVYPITLTETGGISFGPNPSGSCTLNVSVSVTSATTCTVTGTICGQSLSGAC